jgi:hypothetical protein
VACFNERALRLLFEDTAPLVVLVEAAEPAAFVAVTTTRSAEPTSVVPSA